MTTNLFRRMTAVESNSPGVDLGTLTATADEINSTCDLSTRVVDIVAGTIAITAEQHSDKILKLRKVDGIAVTLPAATGSGASFFFVVASTITSNSTTIKVQNSSDVMWGHAIQLADGGSTINGWEADTTSDTITFNGTTTGGLKGDCVELVDFGPNEWFVRVTGSATGTEATPFSATV